MDIEQVIKSVLADNGAITDVMFKTGEPVVAHTPRGWQAVEGLGVPDHNDVSGFIGQLEPNWEALITSGEVNRPFKLDGMRLRVNAYLAFAGTRLMMSIRRIPVKIPDFKELRLPPTLPMLLNSPSGLLLVSGPTGSGKTTTVAAMVESINQSRPAHVISVEDPIEYVWEGKRSVFSQREVGVDCESFLAGVTSAMRQKPDVIVIGEIRDRATAEQAFLAGESGHLVLATLHASSAVGTVSKMLSFFPDNERISRLGTMATCMLGIVNQALIPRKDGNGSALALDLIANQKRDYSKILGEPDKLQLKLERPDDPLSVGLAASVIKLIDEGVVDKADAFRASMANAAAYEKICERFSSSRG